MPSFACKKMAGASGAAYASFTFQVEGGGGRGEGGVIGDSLPGRMTVIFFFNDTAPTEIYPLSLHEALPIYTFTASDFGFSDPADVPANSFLAVEITSLPGAGTLTDNGVAVTAGQIGRASRRGRG